MILREDVVVEGVMNSCGAGFVTIVTLNYNPHEETAEQALIRELGSQARSFEELVIECGWSRALWTYPNGTLM